MATSFFVVWDGTADRPLGRQLSTPTEVLQPCVRPTRERRVGGYTSVQRRRSRVMRALIVYGPQTRLELLERTGMTADKIRQAINDLLLKERIRVVEKVHLKRLGRCRYVYEAICTSLPK